MSKHALISAQSLARMSRVMERWVHGLGAVEVPLAWVVPEAYTEATRPAWAARQPSTPHGRLVASGEQTFLQLAEEGILPPGRRFIGWTPCFREENFDATHHYTFIKAEVFAWVDESVSVSDQLLCLIDGARRALQPETDLPIVPVPQSDGSWDLEIQGVEVGSYGMRRLPQSGRPYLYGTALAEPRFGFALQPREIP